MKTIIIAVLLAVVTGSAQAGTIDDALGAFWKGILASENFHLLDNASVDLCKDINHHRYYTGSSTYLYKNGYLSIDFIGIKRLEKSSTLIPGGGVRFFAGDYLYDNVRPVRDLMNAILPAKPGFITDITLGIGVNRDFSNGETLVILYGGLVKQF